jgi:hypothetical protein
MTLANPEQMRLFEAKKVAPYADRFVGDLSGERVYMPGGHDEYGRYLEGLETAGAQRGGAKRKNNRKSRKAKKTSKASKAKRSRKNRNRR